MAIFGYIVLCLANIYFTVGSIANLIFGGGDLGPLLTGWVPWWQKVLGIILVILCGYFWYLLFIHSPFSVTLK